MAYLHPSVERAIEVAGGIGNLAQRFGCTRQAIYQWGDKVPRGRAIEIELMTQIPRQEIRPDLFAAQPDPQSNQPA